jgi:DNA-binding NtrC family response regulator
VSDLTQVLTPNTNNTNYLKDGIQKAREQVINEFEIKAIQFYLNDTSGNITKAAQLAHLPRRSFYRLLEKHKIKGEIFKR